MASARLTVCSLAEKKGKIGEKEKMWRKRGEKVRSAIIRGEKTGTNEKIILGNLLSALAADLPLRCLFRMQGT